MAKEKTLEDLFHDTLKDIYFAERKILRALPKMARAASSAELKAAFEKHKDETEGHVERLQQVFEIIGKRAQGKTCDAIEGIIAEGEEIIDSYKGTAAIDAGLKRRATPRCGSSTGRHAACTTSARRRWTTRSRATPRW